MSTNVETFSETAALFALMEGRKDDAARIIGEMLPVERRDFADLLTRMRTLLGEDCASCGQPTPASESVTVRPFGPDREYLCKGCVTRRRTAA